MRKLMRFTVGLMAAAVLGFSLYQIGGYLLGYYQSSQMNQRLAEDAVVLLPTQESAPKTDADPAEEENTASTQETYLDETPPLTVDFDVLQQESPDVIAWLYSSDTPINLPVVQGKDNDYYLYHMVNGSENALGTLFADYRNDGHFQDRNTIIYGHNIKNGSMFGTLCNYKKQEHYDEHPVMWLLTRDRNYKVELYAGYVTSSSSEAFGFVQYDEETQALYETAIEQSTFKADVKFQPGDRIVTLSTCSYEFNDARYVLQGKLIPLAN